jgi:hypothetical protein
MVESFKAYRVIERPVNTIANVFIVSLRSGLPAGPWAFLDEAITSVTRAS